MMKRSVSHRRCKPCITKRIQTNHNKRHRSKLAFLLNLRLVLVVSRFTGRVGRTPSGGRARPACWTLWSWLWSSRSPGWARSKLWCCCGTSPASSSSATPPPPSWSPSWARLALSRSIASSTNTLPAPEQLSSDYSGQNPALTEVPAASIHTERQQSWFPELRCLHEEAEETQFLLWLAVAG